VQRGSTGIGQFEDILGRMRSYATEEKAKRAVIAALDTSGFSRPGAKAKMAKGVPPEVIASVRKAYDALMRDAMQEENDGNWRGASTRHQDAKSLNVILNTLQTGDGSAAHAKRISAMIYDLDTEVRDWLPQNVLTWVRSSVKAMSARPGAKAKMAYAPSESDMKKWMKGWTLRLPMVPDAGIRHFNSFEEAKRYGDAKCGGFSCEISYDGRRVASKGALSPEGSWTKHSRPGAKAKMATSYEAANQLYDRVMPSIIDMNQFVSLSIPRVQSSLKDAARLANKAAAFGEKIIKERVASPEMLRELDRMVSVVRAQYGYRITQRGASFSRPGAKEKMGKATDALEYIKSSIANGKTVYVQAGSRTTKITPKTYAKWEESGKPLFKIGGDGALLMASGSSYVRLTLADEMLARVSAMSRPGAKAHNAIREGEKVSASDDAVSRKIRKLMDEGKPQKQAVAIALDLERRGEL
jgi:hypothetical protein